MKRVGPWQVLGKLAMGSTAELLVGEGAPGQPRVVLKRLLPHFAQDEDLLAMFLDEARLQARVQHPHVVGIIDLIDDDGAPVMVLELVNGPSGSAAVRLRQKQGHAGFPIDVVAAIVDDVAAGLQAVHGCVGDDGLPLELVHRDVTPHNVLIGRDGQSKLADFGVAAVERWRREGGRLARETTAGTRKGKATFLAPEQLLGPARRPDPAVDVYGLGATALMLATGEGPFSRDLTDLDLYDAIRGQPPVNIAERLGEATDAGASSSSSSSALSGLTKLVDRMLAKDPAARPGLAAVRAALQPLRASSSTVAAAVVSLGLPSLQRA